jgi:hypothetical protein
MDRCWDNPSHRTASEHDLWSGIVDVLHRLPVKLAYSHVKGDQNEETTVEDHK